MVGYSNLDAYLLQNPAGILRDGILRYSEV